MMTAQDRTVLSLSVYNALSLTGQDMTADQVVAFLSQHWSPAQSRNANRVSRATVSESARELDAIGLIRYDGTLLRILARDPTTRRGEPYTIDYRKARLVRC